jgi:FkbM family methyltransferase
MAMTSIRYQVAKTLAPYPMLFRSTRALFRLLAGIRSEESYLLEVARRHSDVFFLQIGANDGLMEDHVHTVVRRFGWRGLLLEPLREYYDQLVANYAGASNLIFDNRALADQDGPRTMFHVGHGAGDLPEWCNGLGSLSRDAVLKYRSEFPQLEEYLVEQTVECVTFPTLIAQHGLDRIDVIISDAQGYDLEILRQIDFHRFRPELVIYEQDLLAEEDKRSAIGLLERHGYNVCPIGPNNAAVMTERGS